MPSWPPRRFPPHGGIRSTAPRSPSPISSCQSSQRGGAFSEIFLQESVTPCESKGATAKKDGFRFFVTPRPRSPLRLTLKGTRTRRACTRHSQGNRRIDLKSKYGQGPSL